MARKTKAQLGFSLREETGKKEPVKARAKAERTETKADSGLCWFCGKGKMIPFENHQRCPLCGATEVEKLPEVEAGVKQ